MTCIVKSIMIYARLIGQVVNESKVTYSKHEPANLIGQKFHFHIFKTHEHIDHSVIIMIEYSFIY